MASAGQSRAEQRKLKFDVQKFVKINPKRD
jgi:hypothetical protein